MSLLISGILALAQVHMLSAPDGAPTAGERSGGRIEGPAPAPALGLDAFLAAPPPPPAPEWQGTGLLITGGVLGSLGLITNITRIGLAQGLCKDLTYDYSQVVVAGAGPCLNGAVGLMALSPTALALNMTAFGLVAGGGSVRGRWQAHEGLYGGGRPRRSGLQAGIGAGLMTASIVGYVVVRVMSIADIFGAGTCLARYPTDPPDDARANAQLASCVRTRFTGYLAGITATQSFAVIGVGLLAHGASHHRHTRMYRKMMRHQLRMQPNLTPTWAGVSLTGRF